MMTEETPSPWQPGVEVAIEGSRGRWACYTIDKVHKTGRFTLVGQFGAQYTPGRAADRDGVHRARRKAGFSRIVLHLVTPELKAKITQNQREWKAVEAIHALSAALGRLTPDEALYLSTEVNPLLRHCGELVEARKSKESTAL